MSHRAVPDDHFDRLYARDPDPWRFATSPYEQAKYAASLEALGPARIGRALEVGCSIGVLTRALGERCDAVLGVDLADAALAAARARCADRPAIGFARMDVPAEWPDGMFDLVVLSEVLYFLTTAGVRELGRRVHASLSPGGLVLLVNWLGRTGTELSGAAAADLFMAETGGWLRPLLRRSEETYRLDLLGR